MRFWPFTRRTEKRATYSEMALQSFMSTVQGQASDVGKTAALEAVSGLLARDLMDARVIAAPWAENAISTAWRAMVGRSLIRDGASMSLVDMSGGDLALIPCASWDWMEGGLNESTWSARVTAYGPVNSFTRRLGRDSLVWLTWGTAPQSRHRGAGPMAWASLAAKSAAEAERTLGDELGGPLAQILPMPDDGGGDPDDDTDTLAALRADIAKARGQAILPESTADAYGEGPAAAPRRDWVPSRLGPDMPATVIEAARDGFSRTIAACGCPPSLFDPRADGTSQREALRRWHLSTVRPIAGMIARELSARLDTPVRFEFDSYPLDLSGRASSFKQLVANGIEIERALRLTGLLADDD